MAKIIRLTESDLTRIVKRVIRENEKSKHSKRPSHKDYGANFDFSNQEDMDDEELDRMYKEFEKWGKTDDFKRYRDDLLNYHKEKEKESKVPRESPLKKFGLEPLDPDRAEEDPEYVKEWERKLTKAVKAYKKAQNKK